MKTEYSDVDSLFEDVTERAPRLPWLIAPGVVFGTFVRFSAYVPNAPFQMCPAFLFPKHLIDKIEVISEDVSCVTGGDGVTAVWVTLKVERDENSAMAVAMAHNVTAFARLKNCQRCEGGVS